MSATTPTDLRAAIGQVRKRMLRIHVTAGFFATATLAFLALVAAIWLDLVWQLSGPSRIGALLVVAAIGACGFLWQFMQARERSQASQAARRIDQAADAHGSIVAANSLQHSDVQTPRRQANLTAALSELAVARAAETASTVPPAVAAPARPMWRTLGIFLLCLATVGIAALCLPSLAWTQWNRFLHPLADVPPYSSVQFQVEPGDVQVVYGASFDIRVDVTGGLAEEVELVFEPQGGTAEVLPMFPESTSRWRTALSQNQTPATYYVRDGRARSRRFQIDVVTVPQIESVVFRVTPPAYTREPVFEGPLPESGLEGVAGARVEFWAASNRPLSGGVLELESDDPAARQRIELKPDTERVVKGEFTIATDAQFSIDVRDTADQESLSPFRGSVRLLPDERPFVRIIQPQGVSLATPTALLPIVVNGEDDFGVSGLQLYRSLNNSRPLALDLPTPTPPERMVVHRSQLSLSEYGLAPGDELKFFARVTDNDPAGAKGAESKIATVRIVAQEDFEKMMQRRRGLEAMMSKYQQAERRTERIAKEMQELLEQLASAPPDSPAAEELRQRLSELAEDLQQSAEALEAAAKDALPFDIDKNLSPQLKKLANRLRQAGSAAHKAASSPTMKSGEMAETLNELLDQLSQGRKDFQRDALSPLDTLAKAMPLMRDQSRFERLVLRQRELADRLAALRGLDNTDDPAIKARMRDAEAEQLAIREELDVLLDDILSHVELLPDSPAFEQLRDSALEFVRDLKAADPGGAMRSAEAAWLEFQGTRGASEANRAAEILESFLGRCQGVGGQCQSACMSFSPKLGDGLGRTMEQLLAAMGLGASHGAGPGGGIGQGPGGYSALRSGNSPLGMYGGLPETLGADAATGFGSSPNADQGSGGGSMNTTTNEPSVFPDDDPSSEASGGSDRFIPLRYRKRVGEYFRRVAEESNER